MWAFFILYWLSIGFVSIVSIRKYQKKNISVLELLGLTLCGGFTGIGFLVYFSLKGISYLENITLFDFRDKDENYEIHQQEEDDGY